MNVAESVKATLMMLSNYQQSFSQHPYVHGFCTPQVMETLLPWIKEHFMVEVHADHENFLHDYKIMFGSGLTLTIYSHLNLRNIRGRTVIFNAIPIPTGPEDVSCASALKVAMKTSSMISAYFGWSA